MRGDERGAAISSSGSAFVVLPAGDDVPLDEYAVHVEHGGRGFSTFVSLRDGPGAPLEVIAPPRHRLAVRFLRLDESPVTGARVGTDTVGARRVTAGVKVATGPAVGVGVVQAAAPVAISSAHEAAATLMDNRFGKRRA